MTFGTLPSSFTISQLTRIGVLFSLIGGEQNFRALQNSDVINLAFYKLVRNEKNEFEKRFNLSNPVMFFNDYLFEIESNSPQPLAEWEKVIVGYVLQGKAK